MRPAGPATSGDGCSQRSRAWVLQVRGLEFNPNALHLLASGGDEGDLCIWDVTSPAAPTQYPAVKVGGGPPLLAGAATRTSVISGGFLGGPMAAVLSSLYILTKMTSSDAWR